MPTMPPIPVTRYLVPDEASSDSTEGATADGLTVVDAPIVRGLPHIVSLTGSLSLVLIVPTGLARTWRESDPEAVVSTSDDERAPFVPREPTPPAAPSAEATRVEDESYPRPAAPVAARAGGATRAPARLVVRDGATIVGALPLASGVRRLLPDGAEPGDGVALEVRLLRWTLCAGSFCGPGDFGSRLAFAWRLVDRAVDVFSTPIVKPRVVRRQPPPPPGSGRYKEAKIFVARANVTVAARPILAALESVIPRETVLFAPTIRGASR